MASKAPMPATVSPCLRYRDTRFTSRVLILPDGRPLSVAQGVVAADPDDAIAQDYLANHRDLMPEG